MSEVKLEPCPFCGETREENGESTFGLSLGRTRVWWVSCLTCGGVDGPVAKTRKGAVVAWNTRAPHPSHAAVEAMAQALKEMIDECYSELDMMSCEYTRGSAEALAWESGVRQAWKLWDLSKQPGVAALATYRATQNKDVRG